jgi:hypothetical protein
MGNLKNKQSMFCIIYLTLNLAVGMRLKKIWENKKGENIFEFGSNKISSNKLKPMLKKNFN